MTPVRLLRLRCARTGIITRTRRCAAHDLPTIGFSTWPPLPPEHSVCARDRENVLPGGLLGTGGAPGPAHAPVVHMGNTGVVDFRMCDRVI